MISKLSFYCELFYKMATSKSQDSYLNYINWCYDAVKTYASFLPSKEIAEKIFSDIASYRASHGYSPQEYTNKIEKIKAKLFLIQDMSAKNKMPIKDALELKGMKNVNPNIVDILDQNLELFTDESIKSLTEFKSKYKHYYLLLPGADDPRLVLNLDEYIKNNDLGF